MKTGYNGGFPRKMHVSKTDFSRGIKPKQNNYQGRDEEREKNKIGPDGVTGEFYQIS